MKGQIVKPTLAAFAVVLACTGCAPMGQASAQSAASPTRTATLSAGGEPQAPGASSPTALGIPWDEAGRTAAVDTGAKAMALYARPGVGAEAWIGDLRRLLTPDALEAYTGTDPSQVPARAVTGPGRIIADPTDGYGCHVLVPTDAGEYDVQLVRSGASSPWKVARIAVPEKK